MARSITDLTRLALVAVTGCSFVFVQGPSPNARPDEPCTESPALPLVDAGLTVGLLALGIAGATAKTSCTPTNNNMDCFSASLGNGFANAAGTVLILTSLPFLVSALSGESKTRRCRQLHAPR